MKNILSYLCDLCVLSGESEFFGCGCVAPGTVIVRLQSLQAMLAGALADG